MSSSPIPGRSIVTRRGIADLVRNAVIGSYGVTGLAASLPERIMGRIGLAQPGIRILGQRPLRLEVHLLVAHGLPVAEVVRQVDSAVRFAVRRSLGVDIEHLGIHVDGLRIHPAPVPTPAPAEAHPAVRPIDLAGSGSDVA